VTKAKIELAVYVAGPLYSSGDITSNVRKAIDAAQELESTVFEHVQIRPFVPHLVAPTWQLVHPRSTAVAQDWDDFWLCMCDAMLVLPGKSVGTEHEITVMRALHRPVLYTMGGLLYWARHYAD
jgi:hypothetical protein